MKLVYTLKIYCKIPVIVRCHGCIVRKSVIQKQTNKQTKLVIAVFGHIMFELFQHFGTICSYSGIGHSSTPELTADKANNKQYFNYTIVKYKDLVHKDEF